MCIRDRHSPVPCDGEGVVEPVDGGGGDHGGVVQQAQVAGFFAGALAKGEAVVSLGDVAVVAAPLGLQMLDIQGIGQLGQGTDCLLYTSRCV